MLFFSKFVYEIVLKLDWTGYCEINRNRFKKKERIIVSHLILHFRIKA